MIGRKPRSAIMEVTGLYWYYTDNIDNMMNLLVLIGDPDLSHSRNEILETSWVYIHVCMYIRQKHINISIYLYIYTLNHE